MSEEDFEIPTFLRNGPSRGDEGRRSLWASIVSSRTLARALGYGAVIGAFGAGVLAVAASLDYVPRYRAAPQTVAAPSKPEPGSSVVVSADPKTPEVAVKAPEAVPSSPIPEPAAAAPANDSYGALYKAMKPDAATAADPAPSASPAPPPTPAPTLAAVSAAPEPRVHGLDDGEIRFGMVSPFSGPNQEAGRQLKIGIEAAFGAANDAGGVNGRKLRLLTADDGYEPARTPAAMRDLYEKQDVFGFVGNFGSATAEAAVPYALDNHALFFGALSGVNALRRDPPDRYVFNFRPSYAEETAAAVHYLTRVRHLAPREIAVFAQGDAFGDAGYDGVSKAMRGLANAPEEPLRLTYKRNTIDVQSALDGLRTARPRIKAVIMVATYRAAAKFIEKTRDLYPQMIYTNVSAVDATSLAFELNLLGPKYADGVVVTEVTPNVASAATSVLKYKAALARYAPGQTADYTSFEAYIDANILVEALKRAGRDVDSETLVDTLDGMHTFDLGLGEELRYDPTMHQASHKVWGTQLGGDGVYKPIDME